MGEMGSGAGNIGNRAETLRSQRGAVGVLGN